MRGVRRTEQGIEVVEAPKPKGDGVSIHVRSIGLCQTDANLAMFRPMPVTLGHEFAVELDDGTPVGIEARIRCGTCEQCKRGDYLYCDRSHAIHFEP